MECRCHRNLLYLRIGEEELCFIIHNILQGVFIDNYNHLVSFIFSLQSKCENVFDGTSTTYGMLAWWKEIPNGLHQMDGKQSIPFILWPQSNSTFYVTTCYQYQIDILFDGLRLTFAIFENLMLLLIDSLSFNVFIYQHCLRNNENWIH